MHRCRVCNKELTDPTRKCVRCGFLQPAIIGDAEAAEAFVEKKARNYRIQFLNDYDFGIVAYYWKDSGGTVVSDGQRRLSFGKGGELLQERWLEQKFARVPDAQDMDLMLSVFKDGKEMFVRRVKFSVPAGRYLQQVGACMTEDLELVLKLKNPEETVSSFPIWFLAR